MRGFSPPKKRRCCCFRTPLRIIASVVCCCLFLAALGVLQIFLTQQERGSTLRALRLRLIEVVHQADAMAATSKGSWLPTTPQNVLNLKNRRSSVVTSLLIDRQAKLAEEAMNNNKNNNNTITLLLWARKTHMPRTETLMFMREEDEVICNIPCKYTFDRGAAATASAIVLLLDRINKEDPIPTTTTTTTIGLTWENHLTRSYNGAPLNLAFFHSSPQIALSGRSYEIEAKAIESVKYFAGYHLDSEVVFPYQAIATFKKEFQQVASSPDAMLAAKREFDRRKKSVAVMISNCQSTMKPNRMSVLRELSKYFPIDSFGECLQNRGNDINDIYNGESGDMYKDFLFGIAWENSYGQDYVSEKVFNVLNSGGLPIYVGTPGGLDFLPSKESVIFADTFYDFATDTTDVKRLGSLLNHLANNFTAYMEYMEWRKLPLPSRFIRLANLADAEGPYGNKICRLCNCAAGKLGCNEKFGDI